MNVDFVLVRARVVILGCKINKVVDGVVLIVILIVMTSREEEDLRYVGHSDPKLITSLMLRAPILIKIGTC